MLQAGELVGWRDGDVHVSRNVMQAVLDEQALLELPGGHGAQLHDHRNDLPALSDMGYNKGMQTDPPTEGSRGTCDDGCGQSSLNPCVTDTISKYGSAGSSSATAATACTCVCDACVRVRMRQTDEALMAKVHCMGAMADVLCINGVGDVSVTVQPSLASTTLRDSTERSTESSPGVMVDVGSGTESVAAGGVNAWARGGVLALAVVDCTAD